MIGLALFFLTQETRSLGTIVDVVFAVKTFPSGWTATDISTLKKKAMLPSYCHRAHRNAYLLEALADSFILAWTCFARIHGEVAVLSCVTRPTEAGVVSRTRFVLAHGAVGAGVGVAGRLFDGALQARVTLRTDASDGRRRD